MAPVGSNEKSNILTVTLILMDCLQISLLIFRFEFKRIDFYISLNHQKTYGFLMISGGIEVT